MTDDIHRFLFSGPQKSVIPCRNIAGVSISIFLISLSIIRKSVICVTVKFTERNPQKSKINQ